MSSKQLIFIGISISIVFIQNNIILSATMT